MSLLKCPRCGEPMLPGEIAQTRGDYCFWAPQGALDQYAFPYSLRARQKVLANGGIRIRIKNRILSTPTIAYACKTCSLVLIDCNESS